MGCGASRKLPTESASVAKAASAAGGGKSDEHKHRSSIFTSDAEFGVSVLEVLQAGRRLTDQQAEDITRLCTSIKMHNLYKPRLSNVGGRHMENCEETALFVQSELLQQMFPFVAEKDASFASKLSRSSTAEYAPETEAESRAHQLLSQNPLAKGLSKECREYLREVDSIDFDVFKCANLSNNRPLAAVMWGCLCKAGLISKKFPLDHTKLADYINIIENGYYDNPYHCRLHAADVVHGCMWFISRPGLREKVQLSQLEIFATLIAAAIHDFEHPGLSNTFLIATNHKLAIRYNDDSVLESHSVAAASHIALKMGVFDTFVREDVKYIRQIMIDLVMSTDIARHAATLADFVQMLEHGDRPVDDDKFKILILNLIIKCADIGNPAQSWDRYEQWMQRVMSEFYNQGDREKKLGMPISPFCDRTSPRIASCQNGFINFIVMPMYRTFAKFFPGVSPKLDQLKQNAERIRGMAEAETAPTDIARRHSMAMMKFNNDKAGQPTGTDAQQTQTFD